MIDNYEIRARHRDNNRGGIMARKSISSESAIYRKK